MTVQNWKSFGAAFACFLAGLVGLILKWTSVATCLFFLIIGLLGMIFIGMPIWRRIIARFRKPR